jgi:chromosome segregation ATPase
MSSATQILWIGAGDGSELQLDTECKRLIAVEARPEACQQLTKLKQKIQQLEVVEVLVSTEDGAESFYRYSIASLSSSQKATGLNALFPGLKLVSSEVMQAKSLANLISELALDFSVTSALWLDSPAVSFVVLKHLAEHKLLRQFTELKITVSSEALYENFPADTDVVAWLTAQGYDLTKTHSDDPDFPILFFKLNALKLELESKKRQLKRLNTELADSRKMVEATETNNKALQQKIATLEASSREHAQSLELCLTEKDQLLQNCIDELATVKQHLEKAKAEFNETTSVAELKASDFSQLLQHKDQELSDNQAVISDLQEQLKTLNQRVKNKNSQIEQLTTELNTSKQNEQESTELRAALEQKQSELVQQLGELQKDKESDVERLNELTLFSVAAKDEKETLSKELVAVKQQLSALERESSEKLTAVNNNLVMVLAEKEKETDKALKLEKEVKKHSERLLEMDNLTQTIDNLKKDLAKKTKQLSDKQEQLNELMLSNQRSEAANKKYATQLEFLNQQILRSEAQLQFIKELLFRGELLANAAGKA